MRFFHMTLLFILLPMLLFTVGCSVDTVEESDANILDPASADFHFQNLPLAGAGGSLIPLDEIPVITIEKTREDDDFYYWRVLADPAPIHEDLVVRVGFNFDFNDPVKLKNVEQSETGWDWDWEARPNQSIRPGEYDTDSLIGLFIFDHFGNEGYFYDDFYDASGLDWKFSGFGRQFIVVIPKLQNTSQEFKLISSFMLEENKTLRLSGGPEPFHFIRGKVAENVIVDLKYGLAVIPFVNMASAIAKKGFVPIDDPLDEHGDEAPPIFAIMDIPIFQTFEGYIIREGFAFSYYMLGEASSLELRPPPDPE